MALDPRRLTLLPEPLKRTFLHLLEPLVSVLLRTGLRPNSITSISIVVLFASGTAFGLGWLRLGAGLLLFSGLFDLLDGQVARAGHMETKFGAFYDSTMDRLGEAALFAGIGVFYMTSSGERLPVLGLGLCFAALSGAFLVSYTRARAEGLGLDCKVGMAQRAERIVFLGVPTMIWGAGPNGWLLLGILVWLVLVSWITAVQRIVHVHRISGDGSHSAAAPAPEQPPAFAGQALKGN